MCCASRSRAASVNMPTTSCGCRCGTFPPCASTEALSATLEAGAQSGFGAVVDHQFFQLIIAIADKLLFHCAKVKIPDIHHGRSVYSSIRASRRDAQRRLLELSLVGRGESPVQPR